MNKTRDSNIELLKVIAIIIIVFAHNAPESNNVFLRGEVPFLFDTAIATRDWKKLFIIFNFYMAQLANCIFYVCSSFFLVDDNNTKIKKILHIWVDVFFFSALYAIILKIVYPEIASSVFAKQFLPISLTSYGFISCYLVLYAIHPLLNKIIYSFSKRTLAGIIIAGVVAYCLVDFVIPGDSFFYSGLIGAAIIYCIVAYMKLYLKEYCAKLKLNFLVLLANMVLLIVLILVSDYLGLKINALSHIMKHWRSFRNPLIFLCALSLFNIFRKLKFENKYVNCISSCSLLIYVIHENPLFREYVRTDYFGWVYRTFTYEHLLMWDTVLAVLSFLGSLLIALLYKRTIQPLLYKICDKVSDASCKGCNKLLDYIAKLE